MATDLLQTKHHVRRTGNLSDGSLDIWKTIRVWSEGIASKKFALEKSVFCLVTTSEAGTANTVRLLRDDKDRAPGAARIALELAASRSQDTTIQTAYQSYLALDLKDREPMYLLDRSPAAADLRAEIIREVRLAAEPKHHVALVDLLEGWWFEQVVQHLSTPGSPAIQVVVVLGRVVEIGQQFRKDSLPDDFLTAVVPDTEVPGNDDRMFVRQLRLIEISEKRLRMAQEDFYKAVAQRSRWIKDELVDFDELKAFEKRLRDGWKPLFEIMVEGVVDGCADGELVKCGAELYNWSQTQAPFHSGLWVRPQFQAAYMTKGSFRMLADRNPPPLGWHPHYAIHLAPPGEGAGEMAT